MQRKRNRVYQKIIKGDTMAEGMGAEGTGTARKEWLISCLLPPRQEPSHISRVKPLNIRHPVFTLAEHRDIKRGWWQQKIWCGMQGAQWLRCSGTTYRDGTGWEAGGRCKRGHVYTYDWLTLMWRVDKHNIPIESKYYFRKPRQKKYIYIYRH